LAFEGSTGYLLSRVGALARRNWSRMLAERDLTPHHYGVLMTLAEVGPLGQQQLSGLIGIDPRNVVPIIDLLADRDLLARQTDPADRRRRVLALTAAGQGTVDDLNHSGAVIEQDFLRALSPAEKDVLHQMLLTLLDSTTDPDR
jgi:DNA-binding MarR family transcriptional regulator